MTIALVPPVIVISPALRTGTTLVQRLLCSAPNTLIYGDIVGQEMEFFAKYTLAKAQMLGFQESIISPVRAAVLAGNTDDFITPLAPTVPRYVDGLRQAALTWLTGCYEEALAAGRPIWGWKMAGADGMSLALLREWFPEARWVWIERDLADCYRSAKAAGMVHGAADAQRFAAGAHATATAFAPLANQALVLHYRTMLEDPTDTIARLEAHTGAVGISPAVFGVRVNETGSKECKPPAILTDEETAIFAQR